MSSEISDSEYKEIVKKADAGDEKSQLIYCKFHTIGEVTKSYAEIKFEHAKFRYSLGTRYHGKSTNNKMFEELGEHHILEAVDMDYPPAITHWGDIQSGKGKYYDAINTYYKAAKFGDPKGMFLYGMMCYKDQSQGDKIVKRDTVEGALWIKNSAIAGYADGQYEWAKILQSSHNSYSADAYFKKAADQGHEDAQKFIEKIEIKKS